MANEPQERFFEASDGVKLFLRFWPVAQPKGLLAIVHGFAEHCGRYQWLAEQLNQTGWSAAAFDCRGHGQSGGRRAHIDSFEEYLNDLRFFLKELGQAHGGTPTILLGHSLGGLVAARLAELGDEEFSSLILSSPFLGLAIQVPKLKAWAGKLLSRIFPTIAIKTGLDPTWISHDREVVERYKTDPLVSHVATTRWFTEVLAAQARTLTEVGQLRRPLLLLQAGDDRIASADCSRKFFEAIPVQDKTLRVYDGYYHEVLNEVGRERVFHDLETWMEGQRRC